MKGARGIKEQRQGETLHSSNTDSSQFDKALESVAGKMLKEGMTPKEAMGLSNTYLENIYAQAYRLYNTGKYGEAAHLFRMLIMFNAMEPKYMLGLAACFHMLKEYVNAIQTYTMCSALDPHSPIPHYHSSDCFIQMKEYLSAMLCLELAIDRAKDKSEFAKMMERAKLSLESLRQQAISTPLEDEPQSMKEIRARPVDIFGETQI